MILQLHFYGDPILRKKCTPVKKITREIKQLAQDMIETMEASNGVGLAAPQIGKDLAIFVIRKVDDTDEEEMILKEALVFINPKLSNPSEKSKILPEGCLSIPGVHLDIERPWSIHVEALDLEENKVSITFSGFTARVIMHENDHLNGVMITDRTSIEAKEQAKPLLKQIKEKYIKNLE